MARWLERPAAPPARLAWGGLALGAAMTVKPHAALLAAALGASWSRCTAWRAGSGMARGRSRPVVIGAAVVAGAPCVAAGSRWRGAPAGVAAILFGYLVPLYSRLGRAAP